jgi:hypothetical protein
MEALMSRSYKKHPGSTKEGCQGSHQFREKQAAKQLRHYRFFDEVNDGAWYKKAYNGDMRVFRYFFKNDNAVIRRITDETLSAQVPCINKRSRFPDTFLCKAKHDRTWMFRWFYSYKRK